MISRNKVIIFLSVIMMTMCLDIKFSYSQEKPSDNQIGNLIILLEKDSHLLPYYIKNVKYNSFDIIKEFFSSQNGRYCVTVIADISLDGRKRNIDDFKPINIKLINKRYSFVKNHNQWFGYRGWGPGED